MFSSNTVFWLTIIISALILFLVITVFVLFRKAGKKGDEESKKDSSINKLLEKNRSDSFLRLRASFSDAVRFLHKRVSGRQYKYQLPWFLMVGESGSGKSSLLRNTGLGSPINSSSGSDDESNRGVQWWFFDRGIVIEPRGEFVYTDDGRHEELSGWSNIIKLLRKYRPNRPVDGVILTISCTDLMVSGKDEAIKRERIQEKTTVLYSRLCELQKELGIHFPVYVLFTKCDRIEGFDVLCRELPHGLRRSILGWSNPHTLDVAFNEEWASTAVEDLCAGLYRIQMELYASNPEIADGDDLLMLPTRFRELSGPIKILLRSIFKESSFHHSFFFRGLYFSGSADAETGEIKPLFTRDLFEKKIFPEDGLIKVVDHTMLSKHRNLRIAQVAFILVLIVGGGGMTNTYLNLRHQKQTMLPVFNLIGSSLVDLEYKKTIDRSLFEKKGLSLLNGMAEIDPSALTSVFTPSSWTSTLQSQIVSSMTIAYEKIIMRMMYIELNNKVRAMGFRENLVSKKELPGEGSAFRMEKTAEFQELLAFIKALEELEKNIAIYNNQLVTGSANSREFLQVVAYLYGIDLKGSFSEEALAKLRGNPVSTEILKANVNAKIWELTSSFYDRVFRRNPINTKLIKLKEILSTIHRENSADDEQNIVIKFQNLLDTLHEIERDLREPELAWVTSPAFDLGSKFEQVLESVQNSGFLGQPVYAEMKKRGERAHKELQFALATHDTRLTGEILKQENGRVELVFSQKMTMLKKALEDFFSMKFTDIENARAQMISQLPPNSRVVWNTQLLAQTVKLFDPYNQFLSEKLNDFPVELQPIFEQVARQSLETNMIDLIGRAQKLETIPKIANPSFRKETLRSEVLNFKESSEHISKLLGIFDRLELHKTNRQIFRVVAEQGNRILEEIDTLLQEDNLYMVKDGGFAWWNGQKSPVFSAYNVNDIDELKYYFNVQRDRIRFLINEYAIPIISLLGYQNKYRGYVNLQRVNKWERIISAFSKFEKKQPGNSISILEEFITNGINEIVQKQCKKEIPSRVLTAKSSDFFLNQRNILRRELHLRCQKLAIENEIRVF